MPVASEVPPPCQRRFFSCRINRARRMLAAAHLANSVRSSPCSQRSRGLSVLAISSPPRTERSCACSSNSRVKFGFALGAHRQRRQARPSPAGKSAEQTIVRFTGVEPPRQDARGPSRLDRDRGNDRQTSASGNFPAAAAASCARPCEVHKIRRGGPSPASSRVDQQLLLRPRPRFPPDRSSPSGRGMTARNDFGLPRGEVYRPGQPLIRGITARSLNSRQPWGASLPLSRRGRL